jgi:hypothetical protein
MRSFTILYFILDLFYNQIIFRIKFIMPEQTQINLASKEVENESKLFHIPGFLHPVYRIDNFYFPSFFKSLKLIKSFELRNDDFFSNGYPKSGK